MKRLVCVFAVVLSVGPVSGTTIDWKGLTWNVQDSTTAVVDGSGNMVITVNQNDADDPWYDNWNVYANLASLNLGVGSWVEFKFMGTATGGGPRAFLDNYEGGTEYMFQAGSHPGYNQYYLNATTYDGAWDTDWYGTGAGSRSDGEHSFKAVMLSDTSVQLYFDGVLRGTVADAKTPSLFDYAYLGVTSDVNSETWGPNDIRPGTYTDFRWGQSVPDTGATVMLLGAALTGLVTLRRRS